MDRSDEVVKLKFNMRSIDWEMARAKASDSNINIFNLWTKL